MIRKCRKCKKRRKVSHLVYGSGQNHYFCSKCSCNLLIIFDEEQKDENWVLKNIREAKERRDRGDSLW